MGGIETVDNGDNLYEDNSGTSLAIKGKDYIVVAADTRNSGAYNINTRKCTKILPVCDYAILTIAGSYPDGRDVWKQLKKGVEDYTFKYKRRLNIPEMASLLYIILYNHRFFPRFTYCCLSGFDSDNKPLIYGFDAIGSHQERASHCSGSGSRLLQPFLDMITQKNLNPDSLTLSDTIDLVRDAFASAAETDVKTGDHIEMYIINREGGFSRELYPLRSD